jgi:hypothetical protein
MLGHLLHKNPEWRTRPLRILASLPPQGNADAMKHELDEVVSLARIDATVHVFSSDDLYITLAQRTGNSAALFVQFDPPTPETLDEFIAWTEKLAKLVPDIIYVHSAHQVSMQA